jgi:hypothetical protein
MRSRVEIGVWRMALLAVRETSVSSNLLALSGGAQHVSLLALLVGNWPEVMVSVLSPFDRTASFKRQQLALVHLRSCARINLYFPYLFVLLASMWAH